MKKFVLSAALLFSALAGNAEGISSPSGMVKLDFELTKDGRPAYQVDYKGAPVINPSTLGLELKGATSLMDGFKVVTGVGGNKRYPQPLQRIAGRT